jgi:hypothetical protein
VLVGLDDGTVDQVRRLRRLRRQGLEDLQPDPNQIAGEAFQRMILRGAPPESVVTEIKSRYEDALAKA